MHQPEVLGDGLIEARAGERRIAEDPGPGHLVENRLGEIGPPVTGALVGRHLRQAAAEVVGHLGQLARGVRTGPVAWRNPSKLRIEILVAASGVVAASELLFASQGGRHIERVVEFAEVGQVVEFGDVGGDVFGVCLLYTSRCV